MAEAKQNHKSVSKTIYAQFLLEHKPKFLPKIQEQATNNPEEAKLFTIVTTADSAFTLVCFVM